MNEISGINLESKIKELEEIAKEAAENMNANYRQKLVYNLLNALKGENQNEFLWILLRVINNPKIDAFNKLANKIGEVYSLPTQSFKKWGYEIVIGIMSAEKGGN
ncbi:MAG: hypothetical protein QXS02_01415 [Candidatus Thermoplasmatota archaeon]